MTSRSRSVASQLGNLLFSLALIAVFAGSSYAEETGLAEDNIQTEISSSGADIELHPGAAIEEWFNQFENKHNIIFGMAEDGRTFFHGSAVTTVGPKDPAYPKELVVAYEKAFLEMQADFILQTYGNIVSRKILDIFNDDSTNAEEFAPLKIKENIQQGKMGAIIDKALSVIEGDLDSMLREQGKSPEEITRMSVTQKKQIAKNNMMMQAAKEAAANMSGLVPVQTKIVQVKLGNKSAVQVGVIAVMSENTIQFAKDASRQRPTFVRGKGRDIKEILPSAQEEFLDEFGLRYVFDLQGRPMLVSYGRWSVTNISQDPSRYMRQVKNAQDTARMLAEASIADFLSSRVNASASADLGSVSEEIAGKITEFENNEKVSEVSLKEYINETSDKFFKKVQSASNMKLKGTSLVRTWQAKDENGILHVGSVVTWTYDQLQNATNIIEGKQRVVEKKEEGSRKVNVEERTSRRVNDVDDF